MTSSFVQRVTLEEGDARIAFASPADLEPRPRFSGEVFVSALSTKVLGKTLLSTSLIPSTQTLLRQHFAKFPDGTICVADVQTSGKGIPHNLAAVS